jgi:hypothetical protein
MMTTQPMGTVNQVPVLKVMLQAMQQMTVKVAFLCGQPATRTLSFKIFCAKLILLNFQLWMMTVRSLRPMRRNRAIGYPFDAVSLVSFVFMPARKM